MQNNTKHRVALGLGNNVDYEIVWDTQVIRDLSEQYGVVEADVHEYAEIGDERDLVCSILHHLRTGTGREIFIRSSEIVEKFSARFIKKTTMGGTGIRAALAMQCMGAKCALHLVTINDDVRQWMPEGCSYVCSNEKDSSYPHLIIQFKAGVEIHTANLDVVSPMANRIIYTNDLDNTLVYINEDFAQLIDQASIFLLSGFNVMLDKEALDDRLDAICRVMKALPPEALVFSESGCYFNDDMQWHFLDKMRDQIDIYSMNEEEMQQVLGRDVNLLDADQMADALRELHGIIGTEYVLVHAHCWAVIYGEQAVRFDAALESAATMATTRYRFGDDFVPEQFESTKQLPVPQERLQFIETLQKRLGDCVCLKPVRVVPETEVTTIGLGDSFVGGFMLPFAE